MASIFKRDDIWIVKWKDGTGTWRVRRTDCVTKAAAKRLAADLERKSERQREGLEPLPSDSTMSLGDLCEWWIDEKCPEPSRKGARTRFERHIAPHPLAAAPLIRATSDQLETLLSKLTRPDGEPVAPATSNRVRTDLHSAFTRARRAKLWTGPNPVADVETRRVPKRVYQTLRAEEVPVFLSAVARDWRNLFAAALWTGLRKGELCGLLKSDVDLASRSIVVARSYDRDTPKGGHADAIPIADPLVSYLQDAMAGSPSKWVFPDADGTMRTEGSRPDREIRSALARANLGEGFEHVCRRCKANGKPRSEQHPDSGLRRCDVCGMKMWPRALPRKMRFHDLRHSTATLLLRAKVSAHVVQRILRHASINTTLGTYSHLDVEDLRAGINALPPGPAVKLRIEIEAVSLEEICPHGAPVVRNPKAEELSAEAAGDSPTTSADLLCVPKGIRTPVHTVKGCCPGPLDDGDLLLHTSFY